MLSLIQLPNQINLLPTYFTKSLHEYEIHRVCPFFALVYTEFPQKSVIFAYISWRLNNGIFSAVLNNEKSEGNG